jgi:hypothetical protein
VIRFLVTAAFIATSPIEAQAQYTRTHPFVTGPEFLNNCTAKERERHIACVGFIAGVTDAYLNAQQFCVPDNVSPNAIADFVIEYALRIARDQSPVGMILLALKAKWPCIGRAGFPPPFQWHNGR